MYYELPYELIELIFDFLDRHTINILLTLNIFPHNLYYNFQKKNWIKYNKYKKKIIPNPASREIYDYNPIYVSLDDIDKKSPNEIARYTSKDLSKYIHQDYYFLPNGCILKYFSQNLYEMLWYNSFILNEYDFNPVLFCDVITNNYCYNIPKSFISKTYRKISDKEIRKLVKKNYQLVLLPTAVSHPEIPIHYIDIIYSLKYSLNVRPNNYLYYNLIYDLFDLLIWKLNNYAGNQETFLNSIYDIKKSKESNYYDEYLNPELFNFFICHNQNNDLLSAHDMYVWGSLDKEFQVKIIDRILLYLSDKDGFRHYIYFINQYFKSKESRKKILNILKLKKINLSLFIIKCPSIIFDLIRRRERIILKTVIEIYPEEINIIRKECCDYIKTIKHGCPIHRIKKLFEI